MTKLEVISGIDAEESSFVVDVSRIDDKSGDVFIPGEETGKEWELIPEEIVDGELEKGHFVVDGAELECRAGELHGICARKLETK